MEKEILDKILAILEAQDAKIKALEAQLEASGQDVGTIVDVLYGQYDGDQYEAFSGRHRAKFEPYLALMDKLEGGDSFRNIYEKSKDLSEQEGYTEDAYIDSMLAGIVETINSLKAVVPPEAQEALAAAEEAVAEASIEAQTAEPEVIEETAIDDSSPDEWSEEDLKKEKLEGPRLFE